MNGVNFFFEKMLDGVSVEWKALGNIIDIQRGKRLVRSQLEKIGRYAVFQNSMTPLGYYHESNVKAETAFIIAAGAAGEIGFSPVEFWAADDVYFFAESDGIKQKYLYHFLLMKKNEISSQVRRASIPRLSQSVIEKLEIPIPCPDNPEKSLEIQAEIVRILDAFTKLTAELTTELAARKKQYNYFREELLSFEEGEVEWKSLGELCSIGVGQAPIEKTIGEYAFVNAGTTPSGFVATYNTEPNTITTPSRGQGGIGHVSYQKSRFWCGPLCYRICSTSNLLSTRFLYHFMSSSMKDIISLANMTGVPALNKKDLVEFLVPIPFPSEQERIIAILDKFDALTNSIAEGLPREIALRQKQYEYYRDLLLSFSKTEEVVA